MTHIGKEWSEDFNLLYYLVGLVFKSYVLIPYATICVITYLHDKNFVDVFNVDYPEFLQNKC